MSTEHTPGPWKSARGVASTVAEAQASHDCILTADSESEIAEVYTQETHGEQHANARLIAAAPGMAEALRKVQALIDPYATHGDDWTFLRDNAANAAKDLKTAWKIAKRALESDETTKGGAE